MGIVWPKIGYALCTSRLFTKPTVMKFGMHAVKVIILCNFSMLFIHLFLVYNLTHLF